MDESQSRARHPPTRAGPYRIESRLGAGGMGEVYRAWDERLERPVAIKQMLADVAEGKKTRERFRREARATARLNHRAIVKIYDILANDDGDWIVMELVEGRPLKRSLQESLSLDGVLRIARDVAEGLAAAHAEGIIHRDLKIENVMVTEAGRAKILDFGLAKSLDPNAEETAISLQGAVIGTVRAMSPEQAQGLAMDHRSDLFSFGTLLFETVTGRSPFRGSTEVTTLKRICRERHPSVRTLNPSVPEALARLIDRLLEKRPEDRPQSAVEVVRELRDMTTATAATPPDRSGFFTRTLVVTELANLEATMAEMERTGAYAELGEARLYKILARHDRLLRDVLADYGGLEIERATSFVLFFEQGERAVAFALAYHRKLIELSREIGLRFRARSAIHVGSVYLHENPPDDVARGARPHEAAGETLVAARRMVALAQPGQILLTRAALDLVRDAARRDDLRFVSHGTFSCGSVGELELHEVAPASAEPLPPPRRVPRWPSAHELPAFQGAEPPPPASGAEPRRGPGARWYAALAAAFALGLLASYLVMWSVLPRPAPASAAFRGLAPNAPSVAILGFQSFSGPELDWLATALSEMLAAELVDAREFRLVPGESVTRLRQRIDSELQSGEPAALAAVGRQLEADYVVFGSYEMTGDDGEAVLHWHAVLADATTGRVLSEHEASGTEEELFDLVSRTGTLLRQKLGAAVRAGPG